MRKLILYMLLCMPVAMLASLPDDAYSVYPEVWLRQDTTVQILSEDSISWTDEYTMYAVVRSLQPDSTECLWSFTEDDTVSLAVLTDGTYLFPAGKIRSRHPADFSRWCVYAYHSGLRLDSTKSHSMRLGEQVVYRQDSIGLVTDTLPAAIEVEEIAYFGRNVPLPVSGAFQTYLALKYGITLDYAPYLSPAGDTLWYPEADEHYYHHVVGIGSDTLYGWYSNVSETKEEAQMLLSADTLMPGEYVLLGDDGGSLEWSPEPDGLYSLQCTWRMRQSVRYGRPISLKLSLSEIGMVDSLRLIVTNENGLLPQLIKPDSIGQDSICYFTIDEAASVSQIQIYGIPRSLIAQASPLDATSTNGDSETGIVIDPSGKAIVVNGFPDGQVFFLYLYDNTAKYLSTLSSMSPIDISALPSSVLYIEIVANNQIIGAVPIPMNIQ